MSESSAAHLETAVIGLGSMGGGIARALLRAGLPVWGFDVDPALQSAFRAAGGRAASRSEAARAADVVVIVVVNAAQLESVLFGEDGMAAEMRAGSLVVACSTVAPEVARAISARLAEAAIDYLDAPISGGAAKAAEGALTVMASGPERAFATAAPVLGAMAQTVFPLGPEAGRASAMKIVNQLLAGVHIAAAAEAVAFALTQGIEPADALAVISRCAGTSWMFENRVPHIVAGDYRPHSAVDIFVKDLAIVADVARAARLSTPLALAALERFRAAHDAGLGREDDAAVAKIYAREAGVALPEGD